MVRQFDLVSLSQQLKNIKFALDQAAIVAVTDSAGRITYANQKFYDITGYSEQELIGKTHRLINSGFHSAEIFKEMWKVISSGKIWTGELCNRAKDGHLYWVDTTIVPFLGADQKPEEYIAIRFEITQRKEAERMLAESAEALRKSNRELEAFASVAAHDLQEPLRKIQAFSDRVSQRLSRLLSRIQKTTAGVGEATDVQDVQDVQEINDYFSRIQSAAQRMQILIQDLLTYSRVTLQARPFLEVDLNQIVADVVADLEIRIEQTQAVLQVETLPRVRADSVQMRQLFQNLLSNALKFHKKDQRPRIQISATLKGLVLEIQIRDEGIGFDEKYLDRIFTIFQRLHGRNEFEGTGVGLAVCRRIVERHRGSITAKSEVNQGATFIICLPSDQKG